MPSRRKSCNGCNAKVNLKLVAGMALCPACHAVYKSQQKAIKRLLPRSYCRRPS